MPSTRPALADVARSIEIRADRDPLAPAVTDGSTTLTYGDLLLARQELEALLADVPAGAPVGVRAARSVAATRTLAGLMLAGHPYVPLDLRWPPPRVDEIRDLVGLAAILEVDPGAASGVRRLAGVPDPAASLATGPDAAYVLFTSGSTGRPHRHGGARDDHASHGRRSGPHGRV